jgi:hypothetical protein
MNANARTRKTPGLVSLTDHNGTPIGRLEFDTGKLYGMDGKFIQQLVSHGSSREDDFPEDGESQLALYAAGRDAEIRGKILGKKVTMKERVVDGQRMVLMDLSVTDVHQPSTMSNFAGGFRLAEGVADLVSPVIPVVKQSDYYAIWNSANAFQRVAAVQGAPGAMPNLINPGLAFTEYKAPEYAIGGILPTEIEANADAPLRPFEALSDMILDKLRLEREFRVQTLLTTSGNWNSNNVLALGSGQQWDAGATSDPISNMQYIEEHSFAPISRWVFGTPAYHAFVRNPAVRAYYFAKSGDDTVLPEPRKISQIFDLAPIVVDDMKYSPTSTSAATYVWPSAAGSSSAVVALHEPKTMPPTDGRDVMTSCTFRWSGGMAPDGRLIVGGFLLRSWFKPGGGGRGARIVVLVHNDDEVMPSNIIGGVITGVIQ